MFIEDRKFHRVLNRTWLALKTALLVKVQHAEGQLYLACVWEGSFIWSFAIYFFQVLCLNFWSVALKCESVEWVFKALTETQLATLLLYWSVFVLRHGDELRHTTLNNLRTFNLNPNRVQSCVLSSLQTNSGWGEEICPVVCTKSWWI